MTRDLAVVTGGAGFIGSELVRQLTTMGLRVAVIDTLVNGTRENLAGVPSDLVTLATCDIRDASKYSGLLREASVVYHLACLGVRHSVHSPLENHDVNAGGTLAVLEASRAEGVPRFVYVSSSEVYGTARWAPMGEDHPTWPCTVYGGSKLAGEAYTRAYYETYGYPTVVVRPFNAYGPRSHHEGDSGEVIPKFLLRCLAGEPMMIFGDGSQTRDFTYVSDTASGILVAGTTEKAVGGTFNLGSGTEVTIRALARTVAQTTGREDATTVHDDPRPGDVRRLCADVSQARATLGFQAAVSLTEGLSRLLEWYRCQGVSAADLLRSEVVRNWDVAKAVTR